MDKKAFSLTFNYLLLTKGKSKRQKKSQCVCVLVFASKIIYPIFELCFSFSVVLGQQAFTLFSDLSDGSIQTRCRFCVNPHQQTPTRWCPEWQHHLHKQEYQQIQQSTIYHVPDIHALNNTAKEMICSIASYTSCCIFWICISIYHSLNHTWTFNTVYTCRICHL